MAVSQFSEKCHHSPHPSNVDETQQFPKLRKGPAPPAVFLMWEDNSSLSKSNNCIEVTAGSKKNGHILPTGQWYAPSAVINDALIMQ